MEELDPTLYTIVWIAPLLIEAQAALHMLDNRDINGHNIVVATLPAGHPYGTGSAGALAGQVKKFFPNLWFGLLVGVAAGLPNLDKTPPVDIRLGDVLVGLPEGDSTGLIAYDLGKETADGFQPLRFGHVLANTEAVVRSAIGNIRMLAPNDTAAFLPFYDLIKDKEHSNGTFADPGQENDTFYQMNNKGIGEPAQRPKRQPNKRTRVWYGTIGSGEKLTKSARKRNELRDRYGVIGLEMEAAGTMNTIPVGVIRGACDYADEHKNKEWQPYAAAMAAAYAKAVIHELGPRKAAPRQGAIKQSPHGAFWRDIPPNTDRFFGRERELHEMEGSLESTSQWRGVVLCGISGSGKTQLAREYVSRHGDKFSAVLWIDASSEESIEQSMSGLAHVTYDEAPEPRRQGENRLPYEHVLEWIRTTPNGNCLVVIDNANDTIPNRRLLGPFKAPGNGALCVTSTTRVTAKALGLKQIIVERLDIQASQSLLLWRAYESEEDQATEICDLARQIATLLDGFPLALELAGSLNRHGIISLHEFSEHYITSYPDLAQPRIDAGIWTWTRTGSVDFLFGMLDALYESLASKSKESALLLTLCSVFGPLQVPVSLLHELKFHESNTYSDEKSSLEKLQNLMHSKLKLNTSVHELSEVFLATKKQTADRSLIGFSLHASICQWRISTMKQREFWVIQAAYSISKHIQSTSSADGIFRFFRIFRRCLDAVQKYIDPSDLEPPHGKFAAPYFTICLCGGDVYLSMRKPDDSKKLFTAALTYTRTLSDADVRSEDILRCLNGLATSCEKTKDLETAEEALISATDIAKRGQMGDQIAEFSHRLQQIKKRIILEQQNRSRAVVASKGTKQARSDQESSNNLEIPLPNDSSSPSQSSLTWGLILEESVVFISDPERGKDTESLTRNSATVRGMITILSAGDVELESLTIELETIGLVRHSVYPNVFLYDKLILGPFSPRTPFVSSHGNSCTYNFDGDEDSQKECPEDDENDRNASVLLSPGTHNYLFEFVLNHFVPETTDGLVNWGIRATTKSPDINSSQHLQQELRVVRIPPHLNSKILSPKQVSEKWADVLSLNVELFDVYAISKKAPITVDLKLLTPKIEIESITFSIIEKSRYFIEELFLNEESLLEHELLKRQRIPVSRTPRELKSEPPISSQA
ncbi:hypothetical protein F53441_680 [Fusarium austroafricanum]|uniref:NB-ARC domain-containing protein n=1 Tax=Fusarium austroafricanum TaxID=2364996 RepID=A0A8H4P5Y2_9HYPO|nr:hypothetical protein F53441_680 [Fusarium austroafricanum]